jgi:hypothetical protein
MRARTHYYEGAHPLFEGAHPLFEGAHPLLKGALLLLSHSLSCAPVEEETEDSQIV